MTRLDEGIQLANDLREHGVRFEFYREWEGWFYHPQASNDLLRRPQGAALPFYEAAFKFERTMEYLGVTAATVAA